MAPDETIRRLYPRGMTPATPTPPAQKIYEARRIHMQGYRTYYQTMTEQESKAEELRQAKMAEAREKMALRRKLVKIKEMDRKKGQKQRTSDRLAASVIGNGTKGSNTTGSNTKTLATGVGSDPKQRWMECNGTTGQPTVTQTFWSKYLIPELPGNFPRRKICRADIRPPPKGWKKLKYRVTKEAAGILNRTNHNEKGR